MATNSLVSGERCRGGCYCNRCVGEPGLEDKGKLVKEVQSWDSGETMLAENCFHAENTTSDCQILASLERELQASFWFEDGNGRPFNSV